MKQQNRQHPSRILLFIALALLAPFYSFAQTCTGGLSGSNLQNCTGTDYSPCHKCDVNDMQFEIRAPDGVTTSGWQTMTYSTGSGTCSAGCADETWTKSYGYTFCPQEGTYSARIKAGAQNSSSYGWETSDWNTSFYTVNWDSSQGWCTCKTGSSANWFATVSGGSNGQCCGDDGANDNFYYHSAEPSTATSLDCTRCLNGTKYGPITLYGNGYLSGSGTSRTCYYGDINCTAGSAESGTSTIVYGYGHWSGSSPITDTSGVCYYGTPSCGDGYYSHGSFGTYYGNGYTNGNPTTDTSSLCYYGDISCSNGFASNGASTTVYGNGFVSGTTCYYGNWVCANDTASNGASCTLACGGLGTSCCPTQNIFRNTITCSESGCGYSDHDRDSGESYCISNAGGCMAFVWDSLGNKCCGDDGAGDNFCTLGGGSCINGSWNANHCFDGIKNCDETAVDCGGSDCSACVSDNNPPTTTHDANQEWQTTNQTITLMCSDGSEVGSTGCAHTYYCIDDSNTCNPTIEGTTIQVSCIVGDVNRVFVRFYSIDNANNAEQVKSVFIRIDKQNPVTTAIAPTDWQDANTAITLSCSDGAGAGCFAVYFRVDSNPSKNVSFGSWTSYEAPIIFSSDGNYLIEFYSKDNVFNTETTNVALVLIDKRFASLGNESLYSSYTDYNGVIVVPITVDGNYRIDYNSTDIIGNIEQIRTGWAALDKTPPSTTNDLNTAWQRQNFSITLSCSDATSGCALTRYRIDLDDSENISMGAWQNYSSPINISSDGNWAIDYNSMDVAGMRESIRTIYALLDKTAPIVSHDANTAWVNEDQVVHLTSVDTTSGINATYYCVSDANNCIPSTSGNMVNVTCTANSICHNYVRYYAIDNAGNQSNVSATSVIRIDKENPLTTTDANTLCQKTDQNIVISSSDGSGSGIAGTYYCVDDSNSCTPSTSGTIVTVSCATGSTCQKFVRYRSQDIAGNTESIRSILLTIDKQAPTTTDDANSQWQSANQSITLTPTDGSGCGVLATYYCVDSDNSCTPSTVGSSVSVSCAENSVCQKYVRYYSVDTAGNSETIKSVLIRVDRQPPITQHDANTAWRNFNQTVHFTLNDGSGCGGNAIYYCIDDSNSCNPNILDTSANITCDANAVCQKYLRFKGIDCVGNQEQVRAVLIRIDKNAPLTSSNAPINCVSSDQQIALTPIDGSGSGVLATYYCVDSDNSCTPSTVGSSVSVSCAENSVCQKYVRYYS
ncbi:MAG: hypothetical protein QXK06_04870, partial [Candidatus Diapherotrites archaeon]